MFQWTSALLKGWVGMIGVIFILHFGSFQLLAVGWQAAGINATPLMQSPASSKSVAEFWGRRWNSAFNQLAHHLLFRSLYRRVGISAATMIVFGVSGVVHDLVISVPARGRIRIKSRRHYSFYRGAGLLFERSMTGRNLGLTRGWPGRIYTIVITAGPAFGLFHPIFIRKVILPMLDAIGAT